MSDSIMLVFYPREKNIMLEPPNPNIRYHYTFEFHYSLLNWISLPDINPKIIP